MSKPINHADNIPFKLGQNSAYTFPLGGGIISNAAAQIRVDSAQVGFLSQQKFTSTIKSGRYNISSVIIFYCKRINSCGRCYHACKVGK